jgi:hypothetical protein
MGIELCSHVAAEKTNTESKGSASSVVKKVSPETSGQLKLLYSTSNSRGSIIGTVIFSRVRK